MSGYFGGFTCCRPKIEATKNAYVDIVTTLRKMTELDLPARNSKKRDREARRGARRTRTSNLRIDEWNADPVVAPKQTELISVLVELLRGVTSCGTSSVVLFRRVSNSREKSRREDEGNVIARLTSQFAFDNGDRNLSQPSLPP